ncbi:MAG TPA: GNAT family N-acetyltransferase [Beijerinckiaceae bacterium]
MTRPPEVLRTARLVLRPWREADLAPFRAMNADPQVMRFFARPLSGDESDVVARRLMGFFDEGLGPWAVEVPGEAPFIGFVGAWPTRAELPFAPAVEVGWRLARPWWGRGYAPEAARAALEDAFARFDLDEVVAYAAAANAPSLAVMRRIGMRQDREGGFDHPRYPEDDPNRRSVLFRLSREAFLHGGGAR